MGQDVTISACFALNGAKAGQHVHAPVCPGRHAPVGNQGRPFANYRITGALANAGTGWMVRPMGPPGAMAG